MALMAANQPALTQPPTTTARAVLPTPLSIEVDPTFAYYKNRSDESIAAEIAAHGYKAVRYEVTADSDIRASLIAAFHRHGIQVWYVTFLNGVYTRKDLPSDWQSWKMVTRGDLLGKPENHGFEYLCLNNYQYRHWKKAQIIAVLSRFHFDGVDLKEPYWPDYPGPGSLDFGCFCASCRNAFGSPLPDILHPASVRSIQRNPKLWQHWLQFRRDSLTADMNDILNGPGGIRQVCPKVRVDVWSLALLGRKGMQQVRDDNGEDAVQLARTLHPDALCLETDWPDWEQPNLPGNYVAGYRPFLDAVRHTGLTLPVFIEADLGSSRDDRRSVPWIERFERTCSAVGFSSPTLYEYSIAGRFYTDPPKVLTVQAAPGKVTLIFSKRLNSAVALNRARYTLTSGHIQAIRVDGATVTLTLSGITAGEHDTLHLEGFQGMPNLRNFPGGMPMVSGPQTLRLIFDDRSRSLPQDHP
jgi:hypothetical protein